LTKKQIDNYIWRWQKLLRLTEWDVGFAMIPSDRLAEQGNSDKVAEITTARGNMTAIISLAAKRPDDEIKGDIRHELLHLTLNDIREFVVGLTAHLGPQARALAEDAWDDIDERTVLRLARMIDELLGQQNAK